MSEHKILVIDDDKDLCSILVEQLQVHKEFNVLYENDARKGLDIATRSNISLIIMDVSLPDIDGREAVKLLRQHGFRAPVIMLIEEDIDFDTVLGLEAGANDYVIKPFRFAILLARIRAQLRQHEQCEDAIFKVGPYTLKPSQKVLFNEKGAKIYLTEKETAIIKYLYRAGGNIINRNLLLEEVWGYNPGVTTHTLETHVYRLRQKIEKDPSNSQILITDSGGYKLIF
ncbi:MAG: Two-component response regulator [Candidatus Tokpelaia sp. JSC188]|nr:MAG: Two-component response regulator [Candidatus Tokpelaia sp. JSC188]